jgi:hypothetical protein
MIPLDCPEEAQSMAGISAVRDPPLEQRTSGGQAKE